MWAVSSLAPRLGRERALDIVVLGCAAVAALWLTPYVPFRVHGLFLDRWYGFMAGVLVWRALLPGASRLSRAMAPCYLMLLALLAALYSSSLMTATALATALLLLVCGYTGWLVRCTGGRLLQWGGLISYSLYLTHSAVTGAGFRIGTKVLGSSAWSEAVLLVLVTVACCVFAWLFYLAFERPGVRWSKMIKLHGRGSPTGVPGPLTAPLAGPFSTLTSAPAAVASPAAVEARRTASEPLEAVVKPDTVAPNQG
jgi:peptidoglycan/LPS O-acetylase OafA/YrhL